MSNLHTDKGAGYGGSNNSGWRSSGNSNIWYGYYYIDYRNYFGDSKDSGTVPVVGVVALGGIIVFEWWKGSRDARKFSTAA